MGLYIPKKIKIGFQKRSGTYTGKLAYVIYFDDKGVLRKEKSWEGWRDKKIEPIEFDNEPTSGFCLNKDIHRYSDWGSGRTVIRVYDPRDFEFEITTDNLIGILMHTDCLKRGLQGDFVYAWAGTELVLLPTCSDEYQNAVKFTGLQALKVGAKEMKLGYSYLFKNQTSGIYLGKHNYTDKYSGKVSKRHVYFEDKSQELEFFSGLSNVAKVTSQTEVTDEYMKGLDAMKTSRYLQEVDKYVLLPASKFNPDRMNYWAGCYVLKAGDFYFSLSLSRSYTDPSVYEVRYISKFLFVPSTGLERQGTAYYYQTLDGNKNLLKSVYPTFDQQQIELKDLESLPFLEEYVIFKNGEKTSAYDY